MEYYDSIGNSTVYDYYSYQSMKIVNDPIVNEALNKLPSDYQSKLTLFPDSESFREYDDKKKAKQQKEDLLNKFEALNTSFDENKLKVKKRPSLKNFKVYTITYITDLATENTRT